MSGLTARLRDLQRDDWIGVALLCVGVALTAAGVWLITAGGPAVVFGVFALALAVPCTLMVGYELRGIWALTKGGRLARRSAR